MPNITFLHNSRGIHYVHKAWVNSIGASCIKESFPHNLSMPVIPRFFATLINFFKIPKGTKFLLCESSSYVFTGAFWKILGRGRKLGLILAEPKLYYLSKKSNLIKKIYFQILKKVDMFVAVSPMMASFVPKELQSRVIVVPTFKSSHIGKISPGLKSKNIMFMARTSIEKGVDLLVDAFIKLREKHPDSKLYIIGAGTYLFGQGNLQKKLIRKNIPGVIFTGRVPSVEDYMKKCAIYSSMARIDPAPVSILEAMSQGLVPVVSKGVGNSYIVEKISKELVVENPEQAAAVMAKLFESPKLLEKYSKLAVDIVKEYDEKTSVAMFKNLTKQFMEGI